MAVRRDLINLYTRAKQIFVPGDERFDQNAFVASTKAAEELDRYMIAFFRLQEDEQGVLFFNFLSGIHNGGWYDKNLPNIQSIDERMKKHATQNASQSYTGANGVSTEPKGEEDPTWPNEQYGVVASDPVIKDESSPLNNWWRAHEFCWHAKSPFFVWHRPYMLLFEALLQQFDIHAEPNMTKEEDSLVAAHYFGWEGWDGCSAHPLFFSEKYTLISSRYRDLATQLGMPTTFRNPLFRFYAPRRFAEQLAGFQPPGLTDANATGRDPAYTDPFRSFSATWRYKALPVEGVDALSRRGTGDLIRESMSNPCWLAVSSVEYSPAAAMEEPHNRFHNRLGGLIVAGGPKQTGTMTTNQSSYDPIFWVHHSNCERQLVSWQNIFLSGPNVSYISRLSNQHAQFRLYPWGKPEAVREALRTVGNLPTRAQRITQIINAFIPTVVDDSTVSTMSDWFNSWSQSTNRYDLLHQPGGVEGGKLDPRRRNFGSPRLLTLSLAIDNQCRRNLPIGSCEYTLKIFDKNGILLGSSSTNIISSAASGNCDACESKPNATIPFDVSHVAPLQAAYRKSREEERKRSSTALRGSKTPSPISLVTKASELSKDLAEAPFKFVCSFVAATPANVPKAPIESSAAAPTATDSFTLVVDMAATTLFYPYEVIADVMRSSKPLLTSAPKETPKAVELYGFVGVGRRLGLLDRHFVFSSQLATSLDKLKSLAYGAYGKALLSLRKGSQRDAFKETSVVIVNTYVDTPTGDPFVAVFANEHMDSSHLRDITVLGKESDVANYRSLFTTEGRVEGPTLFVFIDGITVEDRQPKLKTTIGC